MFKKSLLVLLFVSLAGCQLIVPGANQRPKPKNIILFIGDGMGPAYMKAYRMYQDLPSTAKVETTVFDRMLVGTLRTDPRGASGDLELSSNKVKDLTTEKKIYKGAVTDSAAAASAYATGIKVFNRELSISVDKKPLLTVLEQAKKNGLSTGLVATSPLTGATPAAFVTHQPSRYAYNKIADQYFDNQHENKPFIDVMLGGGKQYFIREERNIVKEFESLGYGFIDSKTALLGSNNPKMIGLFADNAIKKMLDRDANTPSLAEMTQVALAQLSKNPNGFFLMVEASQIDWAGHRNDIVGVMSEMRDFELAVLEAVDFAKNHHQTQIIVTADHSTGGLSVGAEVNGQKKYHWKSEVVQSFSKTPEEVLRLAAKSGDLLAELTAASDIQLSEQEVEKINAVKLDANDNQASKISIAALAVITKIVNDRSYTGWTTHGHTGTDVFLYASGPFRHELVGHWDNTKIGKIIFEWLK